MVRHGSSLTWPKTGYKINSELWYLFKRDLRDPICLFEHYTEIIPIQRQTKDEQQSHFNLFLLSWDSFLLCKAFAALPTDKIKKSSTFKPLWKKQIPTQYQPLQSLECGCLKNMHFKHIPTRDSVDIEMWNHCTRLVFFLITSLVNKGELLCLVCVCVWWVVGWWVE